MVQPMVPDCESDPIRVESMPDHFVRYRTSSRVSRTVEMKIGVSDLGELRCFALRVYLVNKNLHNAFISHKCTNHKTARAYTSNAMIVRPMSSEVALNHHKQYPSSSTKSTDLG